MNILEVKNYSIKFRTYVSFLKQDFIQPIMGLNLEVPEGKIVAIVGASGSGKSLLAHGIVGILPENAFESGEILYKNKNLNENRKALLDSEISFIPQSINYLDPLMKVGEQVKRLINGENKEEILDNIFKKFDLPPEVKEKYPFQISGGMARRILIACAVVRKPKLIIADEPTPGLDKDLLDEVLKYFKDLKQQGISILMITHDLQAAKELADSIAIFYDGKTIVTVQRKDFLNNNIKNEYAKSLFEHLPENKFIDIPQEKSDKKISCLKIKDLSYGYNKNKILFKGLNEAFYSNEVVGICGVSGFGKSTLAKLLTGYIKPLTGEILLDEKVIPSEGYNPIQLIYQHPEKSLDNLWKLEKSLNEFCEVPDSAKDDMKIKEIWLNRYPHEISGGEMQRFCIARVLNEKTRFLVADEMTTMFDSINQAEIWKETLKFTRKNNVGVIVISHDRELLNRICDRIIEFN